MDLRGLLRSRDAVSPVIGVVLMVAITVTLAAVVGTLVLGATGTSDDSAPSADIRFNYDETNDELVAIHNGGDKLREENSDTVGFSVPSGISCSSGSTRWLNQETDGSIDPGDKFYFAPSLPNPPDVGCAISSLSSGQEFTLIWVSSSSRVSQPIGSYTIP